MVKMRKIFLFALAMSFAMCPMPVMAQSENVRFFVSNNAKTEGDGSLTKPFASLESAKLAIRKLKEENKYPSGGVTVMIRGGNYYLSDGFSLSAEDGGEDGAPVVWCAYPGENVKFIGGAELRFSDFEPLTDEKVLSKTDPQAKGKIYQVNLNEKGITPYDKLNVTGHASYYTIKFGITEGTLPVPELYFNGEVMPIARYPDNGEYMKVGEVTDPGDDMGDWYYENTDPNKPKAPKPGTFKVDDERVARWVNADQAWVFGYWKWDWSDQTMPVSKIDVDEKTITPYYQSYYAITKGQRFYIYNLLEELTSPGEWFLDKSTNILYVYPYDTNPQSTVLLGFSSNPVIDISGAENIKIKDIEVTGTRNCGINISKSKNINLSYLSVNKISGEGIIMSGENLTVEGCHIYTIGKKGIDSFGGDFDTLKPSGNKMINNHIHDFGRIITTYEGAIRCNDVGALIKNNLIYDGTHLGLNIKGNDNIVEYNDIHDVLKTSSDMGAIYSGQLMTQRGNVYRYNAIHDLVTDSAQTSHSIIGIYLDDMYCGTDIYSNLFYNISGNGVFINGGRDNTVKHNIFANCTHALTLSPAGISWGRKEYWENGSSTYGLRDSNAVPFKSEAYSKYPNLANILEDEPLLPKYNVYDENICYDVDKEFDIRVNDTGLTVEKVRALGVINDSYTVTGGAEFKNAAEDDYSLDANSEIYEKYPDFEKIDTSRIGLISSQLKGVLGKDCVAVAIGKPVSYVNWKREVIDPGNIDVVPFIENNKTYVPLRFLCDKLKAEVEWKNDAAYVNYNGCEYVFKNGDKTVTADGKEIELEAEMVIKNSRIFLPLRAVSELFEKQVFWDDCGLVVVSGKNIEKYMNEDRVNDLFNRM